MCIGIGWRDIMVQVAFSFVRKVKLFRRAFMILPSPAVCSSLVKSLVLRIAKRLKPHQHWRSKVNWDVKTPLQQQNCLHCMQQAMY